MNQTETFTIYNSRTNKSHTYEVLTPPKENRKTFFVPFNEQELEVISRCQGSQHDQGTLMEKHAYRPQKH